MKEANINVTERVVCRNNEFYIIFQYPSDQYKRLNITSEMWETIRRLVKDEQTKFNEKSVYDRDKRKFIKELEQNDIIF